MEVDDIFGYDKLVTAERASLQKGMNYRVRKDYSVFLMSLRENAPYADALDDVTGACLHTKATTSRNVRVGLTRRMSISL
jgi:hypothetical protein